MKVLLDTHAFLWWVTGDSRLSEQATEVISDRANTVLFSVVSAWEIVIKSHLGKVKVSGPLDQWLRRQLMEGSFEVLPVNLPHVLKVHDLPNHHRDPFDRLLVAQAMAEEIEIVSCDRQIQQYDAKIVW